MGSPIKFKNVTRYQLKEIYSSIIFFMLISVINIFLGNPADFPVLRLIIGSVIFSLLVSAYEMYWSKKLEKYLRASSLLIVSIFYYSFIFFCMMLSSIYITLIFKDGFSVREAMLFNVTDLIPENFRYMLFYLFVFLTIHTLIRQLKIRTLHGVVKHFFFKKRSGPIRDTRIFMFMDLISSTSYAEKLGYSKYSSFIKDIYRELDEFVLETKGNIYQYVGDEVVIVWPLNEGIQNVNCVRFFMLFEKRIAELKVYFQSNYGIYPKFKAGFHYGEVAIAEIGGILRKDIAFHGDTVNTTARICSKCSELKEKMLFSGDLVNKLILENKEIVYESIGAYQLKGKKLVTELFKINNEDIIKKAA